MNLKNPFSEETKELFMYDYACHWCGLNRWTAIHHILGRVSDSPLNACPIHNEGCHIHNGKLHTFEAETQLLKQTYYFLKESGYTLTDVDIAFMKKYSKHYAAAKIRYN